MRSGLFLNKLKDLTKHMYDNPTEDFGTWKFIDSYSDKTGVFISLFDTGNEIVFSVRGTDPTSWNDYSNDRAMVEGKIPAQFYHADIYYNRIRNKYQNIIFTGYSLGGSICQLLGSKYGNETICFEPYGVGDISHGPYVNNIINFGNLKDTIFINKLDKQVGQVKIMKVNPGLQPIQYHYYNNFGNPTNLITWDGKIPKHVTVPNTKPYTDTTKNVLSTGRNIYRNLQAHSKKLW